MNEKQSHSIKIAEFGASSSVSFDFERSLRKNMIYYNKEIITEFDEGFSIDIVYYFVSKDNLDKALLIKKATQKRNYNHKAYPKFMKIFWVGIFILIILMVVLFMNSSIEGLF